MKISYNWIQEYLDFQLPSVDELVAKIGAQLGAVEGVIDLRAKYQKIVVAKVVSCQLVPDSDHLNVCFIDDSGVTPDVERNEAGLVQVVCGAPNVRDGILVAWLPPGSTVPSSFDHDPFVLGARKLRGLMSNGMLASPQELAIGDNHDGILEVDFECLPGADFADIYGLNDHIIDIENKMFTHRPDCFGILGVAREIAGILGHQFQEPDWYQTFSNQLTPYGSELPLTIHNEAPDLVPRFMAVALSGITVGPSSIWLQTHLSRVGIRPISNIVDATNYFMYLTGQPLHAYDYDKVAALDNSGGATLVARQVKAGEQLKLLSGKAIEPRAEAIVIATDTQVIGLAGVMGGASTEVDATTKNIILESATFNMYSIRRTSMVHGLFSEAVTRFNKGQSPLQNDRVLEAAAHWICDNSLNHDRATEFASQLLDDSVPGLTVNVPTVQTIEIKLNFITARLGLELASEAVESLLSNVGFVVASESIDNTVLLQISVPFWRTDIELKEDIVEEVGRLYGFDNVPLSLSSRSLTPVTKNPMLELKQQLRSSLKQAGANEVLTYSFVHGNLLTKVGQNPQQAYRLKNALSPELQYYRLSLIPSLLEKVHANIRAGYSQFALFEFGKTHERGQVVDLNGEGVPLETERLSVIFAADSKAAKRYGGAAYYQAQAYLRAVLKALHIEQGIHLGELVGDTDAEPKIAYYAPGRAANVYVSSTKIGTIGEFTQSVQKALKLPEYCAGFELDTAALLQIASATSNYQPLSKFPKIEQDICLRVLSTVTYEQVFSMAESVVRSAEDTPSLISVTPVDIYQRAEDTDHKQITLRVSLVNYERTMTEAEASRQLENIAAAAQTLLQAERI